MEQWPTICRSMFPIAYSANPSQCLAGMPASYQAARSAQKILDSGAIFGSLSREPAGTIRALPLRVRKGRPEPQSAQNTTVKFRPGVVNCFLLVSPDVHWRASGLVNKLAAWAEPVILRHCWQWQRWKPVKVFSIVKVHFPHKQAPVILSSIFMHH